jgi:AcrR family transcriptional regulator
MARQIAYDPNKLKQDVMTLFWEKGYAETSLSDLEKATGLNRRQLYNGIGDKRSMFLAALDDFANLSGQSLLSPLESEDAGIVDIVGLFATFLEIAARAQGPKGCMVCSTSQEDIAADADVSKRMNAFFDRIRAAHHNALSRAVARGEFNLTGEEIEQQADALYGAHVALCILGRAGRPIQQLTNIAEEAVAHLR